MDYQRHKASFYRNLVGAFDVETAATAFFNHHAWAKLAVGVAVSVGDEDPLAHLARFAEVRQICDAVLGTRHHAQPRSPDTRAARAYVTLTRTQVMRGILTRHSDVVFFASCTNAPGCGAALRRRVGVGADVVVEFEPMGSTARCAAWAGVVAIYGPRCGVAPCSTTRCVVPLLARRFQQTSGPDGSDRVEGARTHGHDSCLAWPRAGPGGGQCARRTVSRGT